MTEISEHCYGGMLAQLGWCNGHNTKLNCLEYHRDSEFNLGTEDFILLLAKQDEIESGVLHTAKVKAFKASAGTLVEVYATTLHYAPCHCNASKGFRVLVALPQGANTDKPTIPTRPPRIGCSGRETSGCWPIPIPVRQSRVHTSAWPVKILTLQI